MSLSSRAEDYTRRLGADPRQLSFRVGRVHSLAEGRECVFAELRAHNHSMLVSMSGGQVLSWKNGKAEDLLYFSKQSLEMPFRGGVPLVFPQLGNGAPGSGQPAHGFFRISEWSASSAKSLDNGSVAFTLALEKGQFNWADAAFRAELTVTLHGASFSQELRIVNRGTSTLPAFHSLFHTYFGVSDVRECQVEGVENFRYQDRATGAEGVGESGALVLKKSGIAGDVPLLDRLYLTEGRRGAVKLIDSAAKRIFTVDSPEPNVVVWTPGFEKGSKMKDVDNYLKVLCVEPTTAPHAICLEPGASHLATQKVRYADIQT